MWNSNAVFMPSSGPPAAGTAASGLAYAAAQWTQAAENVHRPHVPAVLTVADRQVYVENVEAPPTGYTLLRRWIRNDPEVDVESIVGPATSALLLPGPLELSTEGVQEPPPLVDDVDDYDPEQAVVDLKRHWVRQRKYATALRLKRVDRCRDRLKLVAAANTLAVTQLLAAQQHPGATLQQQQLLQLQQHQQHQQAAAKHAAGLTSTQPMMQQHQAAVLLQLPPHALSAMQQQLIKQEAGAGATAASALTAVADAAAAADAAPAFDTAAADAAPLTVPEQQQVSAAAAVELGPDSAAAAATMPAVTAAANATMGQDAPQPAAADADMQEQDGQQHELQQGAEAAGDAAVAAALVSQAEAEL